MFLLFYIIRRAGVQKLSIPKSLFIYASAAPAIYSPIPVYFTQSPGTGYLILDLPRKKRFQLSCIRGFHFAAQDQAELPSSQGAVKQFLFFL